jgi:eukaryotic-like serine/threonine-protein kinase
MQEDPDLTQREIGAQGPAGAVPAGLIGHRVAHFRVGQLLGGGGMGVLYRGEDTRLGRTVALKFLAPELGRDPVAKLRFLTEARAASALDHPNLCTVLDMGETDEGLLFLAMPLYEGESLAERLARGPLPMDQALDVATQTARGLAKAHQNGIIHRDIKPANLFLTVDGVVKVLDFGIAKLRGEAGPTRAGAFLGTPSYMSPEQTRGEEVDARTDVWSLGTVLYQMLAGRRPFTGGTDAAVVHAVLHRPPEPLSHLRPEVPPEIERIVARMLAQDPKERYADAGAALADLRQAQGLTTSTLASGPAVEPRRRWVRPPAVVAVLGLALAAALGVAGLLAWRRSGPRPGPRPTGFTRLTDLPGRENFPSLSPDGKSFLYAKSVEGRADIFLRRVTGGNPIDLTAGSPADNSQPAYSPNGEQIAFRSERERGGIFVMGATGESPHRLTDFGFNPAWSPDGREIAVATEAVNHPAIRVSKSQIFCIDATSGARRSLGVDDGVQPSWSPHGWRIAFWGLAQPGARRAIWTVPAKGGTPVVVVDDANYNWSPAWSPDGRFLYFASNREGSMNLWRVALDERSGAVLGRPEPITTPSEWSDRPSLSRDGSRLLYSTSDFHSFVEQVAFDPERAAALGPPKTVLEGARQIWGCDVSPDGKWLVFHTGSPQEDLFLIRPDGTDLRQLTNDPARDRAPSWSPDGSRILFTSNRSGKYEAWTIRPDGSELTQVTKLSAHDVFGPAWAPDGRHIGFTYQGATILDLADPAAGSRPLPPAADGQLLGRVSWSPDGRSLAGQLLRKDGSAAPGIVLWSLADNSYRRLTESGSDPVFLHGGRQVLMIDLDAIRLIDLATREVRTLLSPPPHSSYLHAGIGEGDKMLCAVRTTSEGDIWMLSLVDSTGRPAG